VVEFARYMYATDIVLTQQLSLNLSARVAQLVSAVSAIPYTLPKMLADHSSLVGLLF